MAALKDKVAVVTGSGRGLGRSIAQIFAREGAKVVVATVTPANGEETVKLIKDAGGEATFVQADVSKSADIQRMVQTAVKTYGGLDCAVNNAIREAARVPIAEQDEEDWDKAVAVNFGGVFRCMKYEILAMLERGGGSIVNIGSGNEHTAMPNHSWYLPAKMGVYGLTKTAALEYGRKGIRVNAVAPGPMWTPSMRRTVESNPVHAETRAKQTCVGRIAEPEEVGEAVMWLCTPGASYVQGHTLSVDGGFVLTRG